MRDRHPEQANVFRERVEGCVLEKGVSRCLGLGDATHPRPLSPSPHAARRGERKPRNHAMSKSPLCVWECVLARGDLGVCLCTTHGMAPMQVTVTFNVTITFPLPPLTDTGEKTPPPEKLVRDRVRRKVDFGGGEGYIAQGRNFNIRNCC